MKPSTCIAVLLLPLVAGACTIRYTYTKPGYAEVEQKTLKRIALVRRPADARRPPGLEKLIPVVAREYLSVQKDYILFPSPKGPAQPAARVDQVCAGEPKLNGVLVYGVNQFRETKEYVRLGVEASLFECLPGNQLVWRAYAENEYAKVDAGLKSVIEAYGNRLGAESRPFAAATYTLVRRLLEELPNPVLTEDEKLEKIEMME